ncbi:MAG: MFS transporter [Candidatus Aenigmarchaeota archaeon]|nr:MFS transporter [Candidatus Aenigmarchaeota archaeon]
MHKILKILITSSMFYNFTAGMIGPIYAIFAQKIGGDIFVASSAIAVYTLVIGVLILLFGRIEDRLDKKKVFIVGRAINVVGIAGYLFVSTPMDLFLVQGILGVAIAMMNPTFEALYSRGLRKGHEAFEWSVWEGSINIMLSVAAITGGFVAAVFGFQALFLLMTAMAVMGFVSATFIMEENIWSQMRRIVSRKKAVHV